MKKYKKTESVQVERLPRNQAKEEAARDNDNRVCTSESIKGQYIRDAAEIVRPSTMSHDKCHCKFPL